MNPKDRKKFGEWFRGHRKRLNLSMRELAEKIGYGSIDAIKQIESGYGSIPVRRLFDVAEALEIPLETLIAKLEELEPEKAKEFKELERKFEARFIQKVSKLMTRPPAEIVRHHIPFREYNNPEFGYEKRRYYRNLVDINISYRTLIKLFNSLKNTLKKFFSLSDIRLLWISAN